MRRFRTWRRLGADIVMHGRDTKFTATSDATLRAAKLRVQKTAHCSPNTVAYVERFIQTLGQECLDYFVAFGQKHLDHLVSEMVAHYHEERPHQGLDNELLIVERRKPKRRPVPERDIMPVSAVGCKSRLGGLLKHHYRKA